MRSRPGLAAVLASAALLVAPVARAQGFGELALDQLEPAPAGDAFFGVCSPFIGGHLVPRALVLVDHGSEPLVLETGSESRSVVGSQTMLHLDASLALWDRLLADVQLPIALTQSGSSPAAGRDRLSSPASPAVGDVRLGLRVRLLGADEDPFQLALGATLHLPTGETGAFVGEGAVRDTPYVSLGGRSSLIVWSATAGIAFRGAKTPATLNYGAGAGLILAGGLVQVGPELFAATPIQDGSIAVTGARSIPRESVTNAEAMLSARLTLPMGFLVGVGAGLGLSDAIGTPAFRALGGLGWALPSGRADGAVRDTDDDGIADAEDACPYAFGPKGGDPKRSGCPVPESDGKDVEDGKGTAPRDEAGPAAPADSSAGKTPR